MTTAPLAIRLRSSPLGLTMAGLGAAVAAACIVAVAGPMFGIAIIVGSVALMATVSAPGVILAAYLLIPFYKGALQDYSPADITVVLALLNAVQIVPVVLDRRKRRISRAGIGLWMSLPALVLAGVLYGPNQPLALETAITYWALVVLPILPAAIRVGSEPRFVRELLWTFFALACLTVVIGLVYITGSERLTVLGMNTIQMSRAALLVPLLAVAFVFPQDPPRAIAIGTVVLIPAAFIVSLAAGSRGPILALALMGMLWLVRYLVQTRRSGRGIPGRAIAFAVVATTVVVLSVPLLPSASIGRFTLLADYLESGAGDDPAAVAGDTSTEARVTLFGLAVTMFDDSPVFGTGTRGFEALSPRAIEAFPGDVYPHNALLQVAAEFGLAGLAVFVSIILLALVRHIPPGTLGYATRVLLVFFLLNAMVSGDILSDRETLGLLLLVLAIDVPRTVADQAAWRLRAVNSQSRLEAGPIESVGTA
jgi:O-antigen ligase